MGVCYFINSTNKDFFYLFVMIGKLFGIINKSEIKNAVFDYILIDLLNL